MKLTPTKIGAQPKQLAILGVLLLILGVVYATNRTSSSPAGAAARPDPPSSSGAAVDATGYGSATSTSRPAPGRRTTGSRADASGPSSSMDDFRPSLKLPEGTDVSRIDPTLKLDLLAKLQSTPLEGGTRSLFEFYTPPAPPPAVKPIVPVTPPTAAAPAAPVTPGKPAPPPIPLKYYGFVGSAKGARGSPQRGCFLDGDDIFVSGENELIRGRYKIIRLGANSAVVEDTAEKNQQTLPLVEEAGS